MLAEAGFGDAVRDIRQRLTQSNEWLTQSNECQYGLGGQKSETLQAQRRFRWTAAISNQAAQQINKEVEYTAMPRVLDLGDILELVNDRLDNGSFLQEELVGHQYLAVLHVGSQLGDELEIEGSQQVLTQWLREIAFVSENLAEQLFDQMWNGFSIVHITWREQDIEQFAAIIEDQVEFEAEEPTGGGLAACSQALKHLVLMNPGVMTDR